VTIVRQKEAVTATHKREGRTKNLNGLVVEIPERRQGEKLSNETDLTGLR